MTFLQMTEQSMTDLNEQMTAAKSELRTISTLGGAVFGSVEDVRKYKALKGKIEMLECAIDMKGRV